MTNSVPKMSDKVERQGSPNATSGKQRQHHRSGTIKTTTYFASGGRNSARNTTTTTATTTTTNGSGGRVSCSPPCAAVKNLRNSPLRCSKPESSPRGSPTGGFYAGAKFSEPPSPASLPKPPSHWTTRLMSSCQQSETCCSISNHLKMILNVQA